MCVGEMTARVFFCMLAGVDTYQLAKKKRANEVGVALRFCL